MRKAVFKTVSNQNLNLWIYDNGNAKTDKNRTAMIWIHGGGWERGNPDYFGNDYDYFTELGIVCFGVEYRLKAIDESHIPHAHIKGAIEDCIDSVVYVREKADEFGIDPNKIIVVGESAGGHLALCLITNVINGSNTTAIPNLVVVYNPVVETVAHWSYIGGKYEGVSAEEFFERYKILKGVSPIHNIIKNDIPLLLLTGIDDRVVYPGEVMDFYERYIAVGNSAEIEFYANTTHAFALPAWYDKGMESRDKSLEAIQGFMKKHKYL